MGVAITEVLKGKEFNPKELSNKSVGIDAFNSLYQFLTVLRGPDGSPLVNDQGKITSHLQGLLTRVIQFINYGCTQIYVFDGKPPVLKLEERTRRRNLKETAKKQYEIAKERNDFENMRKYSSRMVTIDQEIIDSSKKLLTLMGVAVVQAPSEGEAQISAMLKSGIIDYAISQDADVLLFGAPHVIRNISVSGKKKIKGKLGTKNVVPYLYSLDLTLSSLNISLKQLIAVSMLTGTDYNVGGIKGFGPKKSIEIVKKFGEDFDSLFSFVEWDVHFTVSWKEVMDLFLECDVDSNLKIVFPEPNLEGLKEFLLNEYGFNKERVDHHIERLNEALKIKSQKGLSDFF